MAQFDYLATWDDFWDIMSAIEESEPNLMYIPDIQYKSREAIMMRTVNTNVYRNLLRREYASRIYIWSFEFSWTRVMMGAPGPRGCEVEPMQPVLAQSIEGDFVELADGTRLWNPDLKSDDVLPKGASRKLTSSMFYYQDEYPDLSGRWIKRSPELKAAYLRVCSHMKSVMVRHKFNRYVWIGQEAHRLVKEGKVQVIAHV